MKYIYEFKVDDKKFALVKPSRKQMEDADTQYAVEMSKFVRQGVLTKNMLAKKYEDAGGILTENESKKISKLYEKLNEKIAESARLADNKTNARKNKKKIDALDEEASSLRREIVDIESANMSLFNQTAESKAQNKMIIWYAVNMLVYDVDGEYLPYFDGEEYEDKLEHYYSLEDSEDETHEKVMNKIGTIVALWFFNQAETQDQFDKLVAEYLPEENKDEKEEPEEKTQNE